MAPMIMDDRPTGTSVQAESKAAPNLYSYINEQEMQRDASNCLANYGTKFEPAIITGTKGLYFYTASGHRVLDWTSGSVLPIPECSRGDLTGVDKCHAWSDMVTLKWWK